jgi:nucleoside-diphosphate-sugar epimerase
VTTRLNVVTGATGLVGSHIVEKLVACGERVRALVRSSSDTTFLRGLGTELAVGDLHDPASLRRAVAWADVVYHCAAHVSDWGPWAQFQADTVDATRNVLEACRAEGVGQLLHVSSVAVYGRPRLGPDGQIAEETPRGQRFRLWDYYGRSKLLAEDLVRHYYPGAAVIRPVWTYGPRDRVTMPRVIEALRAGRVPIIGSGTNFLNIVYASDVAEAAVLAAAHPGAHGQAYNVSSEGEVTQAQLLSTLTDALSLPRISRHVPYRLASRWAFVLEAWGRLLRRRQPPTITRKAVSLISRSTGFSTERARTQLGWQPRVLIQEGVRRTLDWYFGREAQLATGGRQPPALATGG